MGLRGFAIRKPSPIVGEQIGLGFPKALDGLPCGFASVLAVQREFVHQPLALRNERAGFRNRADGTFIEGSPRGLLVHGAGR